MRVRKQFPVRRGMVEAVFMRPVDRLAMSCPDTCLHPRPGERVRIVKKSDRSMQKVILPRGEAFAEARSEPGSCQDVPDLVDLLDRGFGVVR